LPNKLATVVLCFLALGLARAGAKSPISLDVLRRDGYGSVPLIKGGQNRLFVRAEINGEKVELLLDTGFGAPGITIGFDPARIHLTAQKGINLGTGASGTRVAIGHGMAKSVVMGNVHIQGAPVYFGRFFGAGFIGRGFLKTNSAVVDLPNLTMYLRPPGKGRQANLAGALRSIGMSEAPFSENAEGHFIVDVELNGLPAKMMLDTGAQVTEIDARFAKAAKARGWKRDNVFRVDAAGAVTHGDLAGTKALSIAGTRVRAPTVLLGNMSFYNSTGGKVVGVLGLDVIGQNWGIIDFGRKRFYFAKAK
jgi:predicted aspartyl protease